jgi:hypothetical protein
MMILKYVWLRLLDYAEAVSGEPQDDIDLMLQADINRRKEQRWAEYYNHPMSQSIERIEVK